MHGHRHHPTDTQRRNGQHWRRLPWHLAAVLALGLALGPPPRAHAKTFHCSAGDVQCLIDAIHAANANGQKNTIRLAAGTYPLTTVDNDTDGPNGLPSITSVLTLQGAGAETTRLERVFTGAFPCLSVEPGFRILQVAPTGVLTLKGLTLRGGCSEASSGPRPGGGGLFTRGEVSLIQSAIVENETLSAGGGGILSRGPLTVTDSTIADNAAVVGSGGGIESDGPLTVTRSHIARNLGDNAGGIDALGLTVITHSTIVENSGLVTIIGGIFNGGTMYITDSTIARNRAPLGGILNSATLTIHNSTIAENEATSQSGGIQNSGGMLAIINSTITRNTTHASVVFAGRVSAGIGNVRDPTSDMVGTVTILNTIVAENTFDRPPFSGSGGPDCGGPITSLGTNLIGDPTDCDIALHASDLTGDPGLGDFTDNGRPGNGHVPLLPTSQAIDAGNDAACPPRDQLGQRRVDILGVGTSRCDIGAIEFQRRDKHQDNADSNQPDMDNDQPNADLATAAQGTP
jgi:hypothetical protein